MERENERLRKENEELKEILKCIKKYLEKNKNSNLSKDQSS